MNPEPVPLSSKKYINIFSIELESRIKSKDKKARETREADLEVKKAERLVKRIILQGSQEGRL